MWRRYFVFTLIVLGFVLIIVRLFSIQVSGHSFFSEIANRQQTIKSKIIPDRGKILTIDPKSNHQRILATNKTFWNIYAVPREIKNPQAVSKQLSSILLIDEKKVLNRLSRPNDPYEPIKKRAEKEIWQRIKDLHLQGIYARPSQWRWYPQEEFFSHILGFLGENQEGINGSYGLEEFYDPILSGQEGSILLSHDALGHFIWFHKKEIQIGRDGSNLILTIDPNIQYLATQELKKTIDKWDADSGCVIVMEPQTGKVLAMESWPLFNPNQYNQVKDEKVFLNTCIQKSFEPGSVIKPITIAAAIDAGKITPETTYVDRGFVKIGPYKIKNAANKVYGESDMNKVLEKSINTGAIFAEEKLGHRLFRRYLKKFGFGEKTGIDLAGEVSGSIKNLSDLRSKINFATAAFGQGIMTTPIQMIQAVAALANGGNLIKPYIVREIIHPDGQKEEIKPKIIRRVIKEETSQTLIKMLTQVIKKGYPWIKTGQIYSLAGKTGTAQVSWAYSGENKSGYSNQTIHSFVAFAPADHPKFIFYLKIDNPKEINFAANSLSYFVDDLSRKLLDYFEVQPKT